MSDQTIDPSAVAGYRDALLALAEHLRSRTWLASVTAAEMNLRDRMLADRLDDIAALVVLPCCVLDEDGQPYQMNDACAECMHYDPACEDAAVTPQPPDGLTERRGSNDHSFVCARCHGTRTVPATDDGSLVYTCPACASLGGETPPAPTAGTLFLQRAHLMPDADGGEQLEWHTHGLDVEIQFSGGHTHLFARAVNDTASVELSALAASPVAPQEVIEMTAAQLNALMEKIRSPEYGSSDPRQTAEPSGRTSLLLDALKLILELARRVPNSDGANIRSLAARSIRDIEEAPDGAAIWRTSNEQKEPTDGDPRQTGTPSGGTTCDNTREFGPVSHSCGLKRGHTGAHTSGASSWHDKSPDGPSPRRGSDGPSTSNSEPAPWTFSADQLLKEAHEVTVEYRTKPEETDRISAMLREAAALRSEVERQQQELVAVAKIVGVPYALDGLPLIERLTLRMVQMQHDDERCKTWQAEVGISDERYREAAQRADTAEREVERLTDRVAYLETDNAELKAEHARHIADIRRLVDVQPDETLDAAIQRLTQERAMVKHHATINQMAAIAHGERADKLEAENARLTKALKDFCGPQRPLAEQLNKPCLCCSPQSQHGCQDGCNCNRVNTLADKGSSDVRPSERPITGSGSQED